MIIIFFPIAILFRSATINFYFIFLSIIYLFFFSKEYFFNQLSKNYYVLIFFIFIIYISANSFFAENIPSSLKSSLSQFRFLFFILLLSLLNISLKQIKTINNFFSVLIFLVCLDVLFQYFYGFDLLGFESPETKGHPGRLSGPFDEELIVGSFIAFISIPVISHFLSLFSKVKKKERIFIIIFILTCFITVLLSGERMSFLLFSLCISIIFFINFGYKKSIFFILSIILGLVLFIKFNNSVNDRARFFVNQLMQKKNQDHIRLFSSAYNIWETNKITGVGLKNYRIHCNENTLDKFTGNKTLCSSHPHNFYFEFLSETGFIGVSLMSFFFILLITLLLKSYRSIDKNYRGFYIGCSLIIAIYIWPIKSSGSFFSTFTASFFWFYVGIVCLIINNANEKKT